ncbi:hypothetical protein SDC9_77442 [bioreactor metagenome]|uniref:DUF2500 domain-containing protein n=1 Tax=bioreactor metagenome TaxID=1076179 RepID=A0A644YQX5_9ZZZZ
MGFSTFDSFNDAMFTIVPVFIGIVFVIVIGLIIYRLVQSADRWRRNNASPILTVDATVVTKRADVHSYHHAATANAGAMHDYTNTQYFVTFQVPSGDRMELNVSDAEFGMLAEQDQGKLTFQGTRYLGFERTIS